MKQADDLATVRHVDKKALIAESREVVQTADDAREIAVKRIDADRVNAERDAAAAQVADATRQSNADMQARMDAEAASADANRRTRRGRSSYRYGTAATAERPGGLGSESRRRRRCQSGRVNANKPPQTPSRARKTRRRKPIETELAAAASDQQLQQAVRDREELRARLLQQFNAILATRDTARGLVVNLSDVLFDTGKYTLRPEAREKLAKISGIVLAYPDLRLAIEGNTDSVGGDAMNQALSEQRAGAVRDYLAQQNIPMASMTSQGFGKTQPVASNDTAEGRQQNRRVEMIVSGDVIGTTVGPVSEILPMTAHP